MNRRHFGEKSVLLSSFYYEVLQECCPVKTSHKHCSSLAFLAQLPAMRITEQPMLLSKRKINCLGYKCSKYFCLKRPGKSRTRSRPRPIESKGPC